MPASENCDLEHDMQLDVATPLPSPGEGTTEVKLVVETEESRREFLRALQSAPQKAGPAYGAWLASLHTAAISKLPPPQPRRMPAGSRSLGPTGRQRMRTVFSAQGGPRPV